LKSFPSPPAGVPEVIFAVVYLMASFYPEAIEVDKNKKPTGRYFDKKIINFHKIHRATRRWKRKDLTELGLYIFQMEDVK